MVVLIVAVWTLFYESMYIFRPIQSTTTLMHDIRSFSDNIGGVDHIDSQAYGPIDVVYTWVNGSDTAWLQKKNLRAKTIDQSL